MPELQGDMGMWQSHTLSPARQPAVARRPAEHASTTHDRVRELLDEGTFTELDPLRRGSPASRTEGVVTGWGAVEGRRVFVYAHDAPSGAGGLGCDTQVAKIHRLMDLAERTGAPVVGLRRGVGGRASADNDPSGFGQLAGVGGLLRRQARASGVIPQIGVVLGPHAIPQYALADFLFTVHGGSRCNGAVVYNDEASCFADVRLLLSLLPSNNCELPPDKPPFDPLERHCRALVDAVPTNPDCAYDIRGVIDEIVDDGTAFEIHEGQAGNIICALARLGGSVVGIVANQPRMLAGVLDEGASRKAARFVALCDAFNIPLITLADTAGRRAVHENECSVRELARLMYAYGNVTVPRISVVLRGPFGGSFLGMGEIGADLTLAWPTCTSALSAAEQGLVDEVIDPADTRRTLAWSLSMLQTKQADPPFRKHGIPPL